MKSVLIVTSVASMIKQFNLDNIQLLQSLGYDVTVASNFDYPGNIPVEESYALWYLLEKKGVSLLQIDFHRSPIHKSNYKSLHKLAEIINSKNFDLIHCQSPVGGAIARIAARKSRARGTKVVYTAHGFHFFKGAPLLNWMVYYPMEKFLAKITDVLITINREDFERAQKLGAKKVCLVHGVGMKLEKFENITDNSSFRQKLGIPKRAKVLLSVGELNKNKNHELVIRAIAKLNEPSIHYVICGEGKQQKMLKELISMLKLDNQVHLLGYRKDTLNIYSNADIFVFPSLREGLSVALMEAMASGLPIIASNIRGNSDLIDENMGGFLFDTNDMEKLNKCINELINNTQLRIKLGAYNKDKIRDFSLETVLLELERIYEKD